MRCRPGGAPLTTSRSPSSPCFRYGPFSARSWPGRWGRGGRKQVPGERGSREEGASTPTEQPKPDQFGHGSPGASVAPLPQAPRNSTLGWTPGGRKKKIQLSGLKICFLAMETFIQIHSTRKPKISTKESRRLLLGRGEEGRLLPGKYDHHQICDCRTSVGLGPSSSSTEV